MASEDARLPPARPPESCAMYQMDDIDDAFLSGKKNEIWYIKLLDNKRKKITDILLHNFSKTTSSYNNNKKNTKSMKI